MRENKETNHDKTKKSGLAPGNEISRRELLGKLSPLGKVTLDASRCTGCGLCAVECPTGALEISVSVEAYAFQIIFQHGKCIACGQCAAICPEKCLTVARVFGMEKVGARSVLFKDELARCPECGNPVGPQAMIDRMRARLTAAGKACPGRFGLCPDCKIKARFGHLGT
jgi:ferredoxin